MSSVTIAGQSAGAFGAPFAAIGARGLWSSSTAMNLILDSGEWLEPAYMTKGILDHTNDSWNSYSAWSSTCPSCTPTGSGNTGPHNVYQLATNLGIRIFHLSGEKDFSISSAFSWNDGLSSLRCTTNGSTPCAFTAGLYSFVDNVLNILNTPENPDITHSFLIGSMGSNTTSTYWHMWTGESSLGTPRTSLSQTYSGVTSTGAAIYLDTQMTAFASGANTWKNVTP